MTESETEDQIRARLNIPSGASFVLIFDQAAHLDWDWISTFDEYFSSKVNQIYLAALEVLVQSQSAGSDADQYYYSTCEMGYLQRFVAYQASNGHDVAAQLRAAGSNLRLVGGGITSPDNLLSDGEAFIRNYLVGKLWLAQTLPDKLPLRHAWLPDDFGHDPELPVVLQALGFTSTAFWRIPGAQPSPSSTTLVDDLLAHGVDFVWQASDGSEIYAHWLLGGYSQGYDIETPLDCQSEPDPCARVQGYRQRYCPTQDGYTAAATPYLYIPNDNDFEMPLPDLLADLAQWNSGSQANSYAGTGLWAAMASFDDFVSLVGFHTSALSKRTFNATPYWTGHYMSRPALKRLHYEACRSLLAAEAFGLLAGVAGTLSQEYMDRLWSNVRETWAQLVTSTHHDFINGTASDPVYTAEQLPWLSMVDASARAVRVASLSAMASTVGHQAGASEIAVLIANPAGVPFSGLVELQGPVPPGIAGVRSDSGITGVQSTFEGGLIFDASVSSLGYATGYLTPQSGQNPQSAQLSGSDGSTYTLYNEYLSVTIDAASDWGISQLTDLTSQQELLGAVGVGNSFVFYSDAGNLYQFGKEPGAGSLVARSAQYSSATAEILEQGPLRV